MKNFVFNNFLKLENRKMKWCVIGILFINCVLLSVFFHIDVYFYDSGYYWSVADPVYTGKGFNLLSFPETYRGCLFPLLVLVSKIVFRGFWGWRIISAIMVTLIFGVFCPRLLKFHISSVKDGIKVIIAELICFYFWGYFFQFPLSDLPATFFLIAGVFCIVVLQESFREGLLSDNIVLSQWIKVIGMGGIAGVCFYAAYNCRVAFAYGALLCVIIFSIRLIKEKKTRQLICVIVGGIFGALVISYPQCAINLHNLGKFSPKVYTEAYTGYGANLQSTQVLWGLMYPRYETYVGDVNEYGAGGVYFIDKIGNRIIAVEGISAENFKITDVFWIFIKHPFDTIGIYTRHLVALVTPAWNQVYITDIFNNKSLILTVNIVVWFILGIGICRKGANIFNTANIGYVFSIILPAFLQMFGAPELRFFFPVYVMLYSSVCMKTNLSDVGSYVRKNWFVTVVVSAIIIALWVTVFGDTLAMNKEMTLLINDNMR